MRRKDKDADDDPLWYKDAIIYELHIKGFKDSNDDGIGDFRGLLDNFDYLVQLGVTCLWILPFHPSGGRDFGYDVTDYYAVDPQLGTLDELKKVVKKANAHNIKIGRTASSGIQHGAGQL